jgi:hypothetical protein
MTSIVPTSLANARKILLVVLKIGKQERGKAKDLSAPLSIRAKQVTKKGDTVLDLIFIL